MRSGRSPGTAEAGAGAAAARLAAASAVAGALAAALGGLAVVIGVAALPQPWSGGYVSEAGAPGAGHASLYRVGVAAVAAGLVLLGVALGARVPPTDRAAATLLVAAGVFGAVSSRVSCTVGCPLPPYERSTPANLVHAGASIGTVGITTLAMLTIAAGTDAGLRRAARVSLAISAPLLAALAVAVLAIGRSTATALLERAALVAVLGWVVVTAVMCAVRIRPHPPGHPARR